MNVEIACDNKRLRAKLIKTNNTSLISNSTELDLHYNRFSISRKLSISIVNSSRNSLQVQHVDVYCGRYRMIKRRDTADAMNSADQNSNDLGSKLMSVRH